MKGHGDPIGQGLRGWPRAWARTGARAVAVFVPVLGALCIAASAGARAQPRVHAVHAIPESAGPLLLEMARIDAEPDANGWTLEGVAIAEVSAILTFRSRTGKTIRLELVHPDTQADALARTSKFAVVRAGQETAEVPGGLIAALKTRIAAREADFSWIRPIAGVAVPADPLNRARYAPGQPDARKVLEQAETAIRERRTREAVRLARALLDKYHADEQAIRAAASILRRAGAAAEAVRALDEIEKAGQASFDAQVERLAAMELAQERRATETAAAIARAYPRLVPEAACATALALGVLIQEGLVQEVERRLRAPTAADPECVHVVRLKSAMALADDAEVDRRAKASLAAYPDAEDLRFLWGTYYYKKGADPQALSNAIAAWEPLVRRDPAYPTLLGQFGTAYLVAGRLSREATEALVASARANPDDVVANYLAGLGLYYLKAYPEVIPFLERAVRAVPDEPRARMYLAMAHFFAGDRETAGRMLEELEPYAYQEPDINYCRSLFYRDHDLPRAIREMERFLEVFEGERRLRFGEQKVQKARDDLVRMRRGEIPPVELPTPDTPTPHSGEL